MGRPHGYDEYLITDGTTISSNNVVKGLRKFIDKLQFYNHSSTVTKKANSMYRMWHLCKFIKHLFGLCWNMVVSSGICWSRESTEELAQRIGCQHVIQKILVHFSDGAIYSVLLSWARNFTHIAPVNPCSCNNWGMWGNTSSCVSLSIDQALQAFNLLACISNDNLAITCQWLAGECNMMEV